MRPMDIGTRSGTAWSNNCHKTDYLSARVRFLVYRQNLMSIHVSVALSGRQAAVAQKFLNHPEIRPSSQEVRGKAVSQGMGADPSSQGSLLDAAGDELSNAAIC